MNNSATTRRISSIAIHYNGSDGRDFGDAERVATNNLLGGSPDEIFVEMKSVTKRNPRVGDGKWALTGYISPPKELAQSISDDQLRDLALQALKRIGVTKNNQYVLDIHKNSEIKHLHFIVNRVDTFGRCTVPARNIGKKFGEELRRICKERGFATDIELSEVKKAEMEQALVGAVRATKNFNELVNILNDKGFKTVLSQNEIEGISGLRLTKTSDINENIQRIYKSGFKLSDISKKLNIREIKEIYRLRELLSVTRNIENLKYLRDFAQANNFQVFIKFNNEKKVSQVFIRPMESSLKNGYFYNKNTGFNLADLNPALNDSLILNITEQPNWNVSDNNFNEIELFDELLDFLKPNYVSAGDEYHRKKRGIYGDRYLKY